MVLWENQFAISHGAAAKASPIKFQPASGLFTKYKIYRVSVTTPLNIALWENQFAISRGVAAQASSTKFQV